MAVSYRIWLIVAILIMVLVLIVITGINIYEYYFLSNGKTVSNSVGTTMMWVNIAAIIVGFIVLVLCVWFLVSRLNSKPKDNVQSQQKTSQMNQQQPQQHSQAQPQQYPQQQRQSTKRTAKRNTGERRLQGGTGHWITHI